MLDLKSHHICKIPKQSGCYYASKLKLKLMKNNIMFAVLQGPAASRVGHVPAGLQPVPAAARAHAGHAAGAAGLAPRPAPALRALLHLRGGLLLRDR